MRDRATSQVDPFDLPEWLGLDQVTWHTRGSLSTAALVDGVLQSSTGTEQECDVLACDLAYPEPVIDERWRSAAHQAWALGEVLLVRYDGRLTLVVPGTSVTAEPVLEALRRLAKAVGAPADRFAALLRL